MLLLMLTKKIKKIFINFLIWVVQYVIEITIVYHKNMLTISMPNGTQSDV